MRRALLLAALVAALLPRRGTRRPRPRSTAAPTSSRTPRTGEVLAASRPHARLPIASITKLMTVLVTLEHHKLTDVVRVDPRAAAVGESTIGLRGGEQLTVRDLIKAALIQSANDAADALALSVAPDFTAFAAMMNAKAAALGLHDTHFVRPDGLDAPGARVERRGRDEARRASLMRTPFIRETVREETSSIAGGRDAAHLGRPALASSRRRSVSRPVTRASPGGARSPRRAAAASRSTRRCSGARRAPSGTTTSSRC